jgi:hypothetical protein
MNTNQIQQGDVILSRLTKLPEGEVKLISKRRCVLAEGEVSGHHHVVQDDEAELIQIGETMLLKLGKSAALTHQEHKEIQLSAGIWEIGIVREYDYFKHMERRVMD